MIPKCSKHSLEFPEVNQALADPNGLLAWGGDLSLSRLLNAYINGIFPWYNHEGPILWWSPDPRCVFDLNTINISKSMQKFIAKENYEITFNQDFNQVIAMCRKVRQEKIGTWISENMIEAFTDLHNQEYAHSVEVWKVSNDTKLLVGGLYGVMVNDIFSGESMFSTESNTSKLAFYCLATHLKVAGFKVIDAQIESEHIMSLGAENIPRERFMKFRHEEHKPMPPYKTKLKFDSNWKSSLFDLLS